MSELTTQLTATGSTSPDTARRLWKASHVRSSVHVPIRRALGDMAPGTERCMYCGDNQGTDIDHHEPLARNPVRTFDWLNHLLACSCCNSHAKRDAFPVAADGRAMLIDPTAEDPFDHLLLTLTLGVYHPLTPRGEATIEVFGLNRPLLTRGRAQAHRVVILALRAWRDARDRDDAAIMAEALLTVQEQPFADVCQAMLRHATAPTADRLFSGCTDVIPILRDKELGAALRLPR